MEYGTSGFMDSNRGPESCYQYRTHVYELRTKFSFGGTYRGLYRVLGGPIKGYATQFSPGLISTYACMASLNMCICGYICKYIDIYVLWYRRVRTEGIWICTYIYMYTCICAHLRGYDAYMLYGISAPYLVIWTFEAAHP